MQSTSQGQGPSLQTVYCITRHFKNSVVTAEVHLSFPSEVRGLKSAHLKASAAAFGNGEGVSSSATNLQVSAYRASHLMPPRAPSGIPRRIYPQAQGNRARLRWHCPPHAGFLPTQRSGAILALKRPCLRRSINAAVRGWDGDKDPLCSSRGFDVLGTGVHHLL